MVIGTEKNTEKISNRKIALGTILGYVSLGLSIISGLLFTPFIKASVGNAMYGIYTLALSILNLFLLDFGLGTSINAYVSKYRAEHNQEGESKFLSATLKIYLFLDLLLFAAFIIIYFLVEYIYSGLTNSEINILKNVFLILAGFSLLTFPSSVFSGVLTAYEEFSFVKGISILQRLIYVILTLISLLLHWGIYAVILAYAISSLSNSIFIYLTVRIKLRKKINLFIHTSLSDFKQIIAFSIFAFIVSLASRLIFTIVPSLLAIVSNSVEIGVFGICSSLEGYIYSFGGVMSGLFMPKIARLNYESGESSGNQKLMSLACKVGKIQLAFILLVFVGFVSAGKSFVDLWLNSDPNYSSVYLGTILLIIYQLVNVPETVFYTAMLAKKEFIKPLSISAISVSALNILLVLLFGYFYGSLGACIAIMLSHIVELIIYNYLYKKFLKVSLLKFFCDVYLGFIPCALASVFIGLIINYFLNLSSLAVFIISGSFCVLIYLSLVWIGFGAKQTVAFLNKMHFYNFVLSLKSGFSSLRSALFGKKKETISFSCLFVFVIVLISSAAIGSSLYPDYVHISSTEDFYKIAADLSGNYILNGGAIMSLPEDWTPIGTKNRPFTGTIDGNGVTIDGFDAKKRFTTGDENQSYYGLIGYNYGTIKNLNFYCKGFNLDDDAILNKDTTVFGLAAAYNYGTIENVYTLYGGGEINLTISADYASIGLIAGISYGNIYGCGTNRSINGVYFSGKECAVGLVGKALGGDISTSSSDEVNMIVDGTESSACEAYFGGLAGIANNTTFSNCYSSTIFHQNGESQIFGGIVGILRDSTITCSYSDSFLISDGATVTAGGITGESSFGNISSCLSSLTVSSQVGLSSKESIGYVVGVNDSSQFYENYFFNKPGQYNSIGGEYCSKTDLSLDKLGWDQSIWVIENGDIVLR